MALVKLWDSLEAVSFKIAMGNVDQMLAKLSSAAIHEVITTIHQAHTTLQLRVAGPAAILVDHGKGYDFFNEVRKLVESAKINLFFVDRYLEANFVESYLPYVQQGVKVKLLTKDYVTKLIPAVKAFKQQSSLDVTIRVTGQAHDRCLFIDDKICYISGASFKDGPKNSVASLIQVTDAFDEFHNKFQKMWDIGTEQII